MSNSKARSFFFALFRVYDRELTPLGTAVQRKLLPEGKAKQNMSCYAQMVHLRANEAKFKGQDDAT